MSEFITAVFIKIVASTAASALKALCRKSSKSAVFRVAVEKTQNAFPAVEAGAALRKWCDSEHFGAVLDSVQTNKKSVSDKHIVTSFIEAGEFHNGTNTEASAKEIIGHFLTFLEQELLKSPEGNVTLAGIQRELAGEGIRATEQAGRETIEAISANSALSEKILAVLQDKSITPQAVEEKIIHARIDEAREILKSGRPKTARERLLTIRLEIEIKNPSQSVLFRLATNLGCCAMQLGDEHTAAVEFKLAHILEPQNPISCVNASRVALQEGNFDEALRLATHGRTLSPKEGYAAAQYIQVLFALRRDSEVFDIIKEEEWINSNTNCCVTIGASLLQHHKYAEAEGFLRTAHKEEPDSMNVAMHLAQVLMHPLEAGMIGETFLSWRIPESFVARLEEAQAILTKTIASNTKSEQQRLYSICLAFRANIRRMLGNETGAIADSKLALDEDAENSFALQVLGLSFMREDNYNEAIQAFESITDTKVRLQVSMPLSAAYVKAGQPEDALTLLEAWAYSPDRPDGLLEAADLLLRAYDALHKIENINNLVTTLRRRWPTHPVALAAVGHQFQRQSKIEEGINLLNEALRHAAGPTKDFIALELADHYYSSGSFDKALDLYNSVADLDKNDSVTRCYLICLFNTGFHEAALALARKLRGDGEPSAVAGEIEALLLEKMGDLPAAQQLFEHLSDAYPHRHDLRIEAVECAVRRGRKDLAREILEKFEFEDIRDEGEVLMRVAQLRAVVRMDDVLRYAYQARRSAYSNPDVHANYVGLLLRKDIVQPDLHEAVAKKDCAVAVETDTGISYFIILNERDLHPERGEISLKQAEELNLLGRAKGDQCVLRRGMRGEIKCLVAEIQNKYARAFQETLEKFPSFFPTKPLIEPVKGNLDDVKDILFTQIDEQENRFEKIVSFYNQKQLGIEQLARLGDRSLIQMWGILVGGKYCKLFASEGTDEDRQQEADRVHKAESLVMDLTSLLTMAHLGLLDKLRLRFKAPIIPQPVLDAVIEAIEENASSGPSITFSKRGSDYVRHEVTSERVADYGRFLQSIRDFILTSRLVPVASLLKEKTLDLAKWKDTFGSVSTACVLAARESASLLFSDDQALRKRAAFGMGIQSVWSQSVMLELLRAEAISNEEYVEAIGKLVFLNYTFVSLDGGIVMSFLRRSEFHVSAEVRAILGAFRGPDCTVESAAIVLSQVVKDVWLEYLLFEPKVEIVEAILEVIVEGRPEEKSIELLFGLIRERFFLMHDAIQVITQIVQNWRTGRLPREGIILTD